MPASPKLGAYLEIGSKRVFAGAIEWPGWCRSGRDEDAALQALVDFGPRYAKAIGRATAGFVPPPDVSSVEVVERLQGNATTDFGAPGIPPAADDRPVTDADLNRLITLLEAAWAAFDRAAQANASAVLRKGPRGGGREVDEIVRHVLAADGAYLRSLGGQHRDDANASVKDAAMVAALRARAQGGPLPVNRRGKIWTPRYGVRRSAWHALDHAWEIEDRAYVPDRRIPPRRA